MNDREFVGRKVEIAAIDRGRAILTLVEHGVSGSDPVEFKVCAVMVADDDCALEIFAMTPELVEG